MPSRVSKRDGEAKAQSRKGLARLVAWGPGSAREGSHDLGRICLKELTNAGQAGQLVAFHVLSIHAVKQEGAVQVLDKRSLWSETRPSSGTDPLHRPCAGHWGWWTLRPPREAGQERACGAQGRARKEVQWPKPESCTRPGLGGKVATVRGGSGAQL